MQVVAVAGIVAACSPLLVAVACIPVVVGAGSGVGLYGVAHAAKELRQGNNPLQDWSWDEAATNAVIGEATFATGAGYGKAFETVSSSMASTQ